MDSIWRKAAKKFHGQHNAVAQPQPPTLITAPPEVIATTSKAVPTPTRTPIKWCNPETMTLEQIKENTRRLLREWPQDNGIPFPREILEVLRDLKLKVRARDAKKNQITILSTSTTPTPVNSITIAPILLKTTATSEQPTQSAQPLVANRSDT